MNCILAVIASLFLVAAAPPVDEALEKATFDALSKVAPSVALIETTGGQDVMLPTAVRKVVGPTTGLVVDPAGYIVTSSFNFTNKPTDIFVTVPGKGRAVAKVVGTDLSRMLTLLKADLNGLQVPAVYPKKEFRVGQTSLALGRTLVSSAEKLPGVNVGIISAVNRIWGKAVQTDAKVSPNNYGGPLVALDGRVMGVLVPASPEGNESDNAGTEWYDSGIGFAIPLEDILHVLPKLKAGTVEKPVNLRGGMFGIPSPNPTQYLDPPVLANVLPKSAAEEAGLKAGDRILSMDGKPINTVAQFLHGFKHLYEGDTIAIKVLRDKKEVEIPKLVLKGVQTDFETGYLGILPMRDDPEPGVEIRFVYPDSPAAKAGLKPGDRIMKVNQPGIDELFEFSGRNQFIPLMTFFTAGSDLKIEVKREGGKTEKMTVRLGEVPDILPEKFPAESSKGKALEQPKPVGKGPLGPKGKGPKKDEPEAKKEAKKDDKKPETGLLNRSNPELGHDYWIYVPSNYDPNISHGLIVWLHPAGVDGRDAKEITNIWKLVCEEFNFIMVGPITHNKDGWIPSETELILQDIRAVTAQYTIDRYRIAMHGSGVGGQMAFYVGFNERDLVRGVATVGSVLGTAPKDKFPAQRLNFFMAAGAADPLLKDIKESRDKLQRKKYPVFFREMEAVGKQYIYEDENAIRDLVRWFESQDRI